MHSCCDPQPARLCPVLICLPRRAADDDQGERRDRGNQRHRVDQQVHALIFLQIADIECDQLTGTDLLSEVVDGRAVVRIRERRIGEQRDAMGRQHVPCPLGEVLAHGQDVV